MCQHKCHCKLIVITNLFFSFTVFKDYNLTITHYKLYCIAPLIKYIHVKYGVWVLGSRMSLDLDLKNMGNYVYDDSP